MRNYLMNRPGVNFLDVKPWDPRNWETSKLWLIHACGSWVGIVAKQFFPQAEMESFGFSWQHGSEWWVITRELAEYFIDERLQSFRDLMQYRINVEEIIWASIVNQIPGFDQLVKPSLLWCAFNSIEEGTRDTVHSPVNIIS